MNQTATTDESQTIWFASAKTLPPTFAQIYQLVTKNFAEINLKMAVSPDDLSYSVATNERGILIFSVSDREELVSTLNFLVAAKQPIKERKVLMVVFLKTYSEKIEEALLKAGAYEVLRFDTSAKAFLYKIKRYLMHIRSGQNTEVSDFEMGEKIKSTSESATSLDKKVKSGSNERSLDSRVRAQPANQYLRRNSSIVFTDALKTRHDYWLFRKRIYAKKHKSKWFVEMIGPSPAAGKWILNKDFEEFYPGKQVWLWMNRTPSKFGVGFDPAPGSWIFVGDRPEYSWLVNRWAFSSLTPALVYVDENLHLTSRFSMSDEGSLVVANNSENVSIFFEKIRETFDQDYYLEVERIQSGNLSLELDEPSDIPWADHLNSRDLSKNDWSRGDFREEVEDEASLSDFLPELDFPLGAEAMKSCGLHAYCKDAEVELIGYSEFDHSVLLGLDDGHLRANESVLVQIRSDNLGEALRFDLTGVVRNAEADSAGRMIAQIAVQLDSQSKIIKIREAMETRQEQIFMFFDRVRGL